MSTQQELIRTVGETMDTLSAYPRELPIGVYLDVSEDGGLYITGITLQRRDDEDSLLYHKGDNPVGEIGPDGLNEMVTIVGSASWPDSVPETTPVPEELHGWRGANGTTAPIDRT